MNNENETLMTVLRDNFSLTSNKDILWKEFLPVIGKMQNAKNKTGPMGPYMTQAALNGFKQVLLHEKVRARLFPGYSMEAVQQFLNNIAIEGPPDLDQIYSFCASKMMDALYYEGLHTSAEIAAEAATQLSNPKQPFRIVLTGALTPMDASLMNHHYAVDIPFGSLKSKTAQNLFKTRIQYETDAAKLDNLRKILLESPSKKSISVLDSSSLVKRIDDRINYLESKQTAKQIYARINKTLSEFELDNLQAALQQALRNPERKNAYNTMHPFVIEDLQEAITKRIVEINQGEIVDYYGQSIDEELDLPQEDESSVSSQEDRVSPIGSDISGLTDSDTEETDIDVTLHSGKTNQTEKLYSSGNRNDKESQKKKVSSSTQVGSKKAAAPSKETTASFVKIKSGLSKLNPKDSQENEQTTGYKKTS